MTREGHLREGVGGTDQYLQQEEVPGERSSRCKGRKKGPSWAWDLERHEGTGKGQGLSCYPRCDRKPADGFSRGGLDVI